MAVPALIDKLENVTFDTSFLGVPLIAEATLPKILDDGEPVKVTFSYEIPDERGVIIAENFADVFKPASDKELRRRNPKPKAKKGDAVRWGAKGTGLDNQVLLVDPKWSKEGFWYSKVDATGMGTYWVKYMEDWKRWYTTLKMPPEEYTATRESFEDIFKPATDEELADRWKHIPKFFLDLKPAGLLNFDDNSDWVSYDDISFADMVKVLNKEFGDARITSPYRYVYDNGNVILRKSWRKRYNVAVRVFHRTDK